MELNKIKIAVTGGPSGGKTTLIETLKKELKSQVSVVQEAASILYRGGFPRRSTDENKVHAQRAIYFTQMELESLICHESKSTVIVCDRGSLDGAAYWPHAESMFFSSLSTTRDRELKRYHWVIHLDTAPLEQYDDTDPVRIESYNEANSLNEKIRIAWRGHPQRFIVRKNSDFLEKIKTSMLIVKMISQNNPYELISRTISDQLELSSISSGKD